MQVLSIDNVIGRAVGAPRRLIRVRRGSDVDLDVIRELVVKHGAAFAGLNVKGELLKHVVGGHVLQGFLQLVSVPEGARRQSKNAWRERITESC